MCIKKGGAGGNKGLLLACTQERCWGWLTTGAPLCAADLLVTGKPQEKGPPACSFLATHALLPTVRWITFKDRSSHNLSMYLIPPKMGGSQIYYFVLQCCKAWPLNLPHSFCNNDPTLSVALKLRVFCQSTVMLFLAQANRNQTDSWSVLWGNRGRGMKREGRDFSSWRFFLLVTALRKNKLHMEQIM